MPWEIISWPAILAIVLGVRKAMHEIKTVQREVEQPEEPTTQY